MTKPNNTLPWMYRSGSTRVSTQIPDIRTWVWEPDSAGDYRVKTETIDGTTYDYTYDSNGCLTAVTRRGISTT